MKNKQYLIMAICLMIMWISIIAVVYMKMEEVTKDPCSICARRMGEKVRCTIDKSAVPLSMEFYPNGTIHKELYPDVFG